ncbi:MAG: nuclear transport factor 2 family protein [Myxococcota bacterium]
MKRTIGAIGIMWLGCAGETPPAQTPATAQWDEAAAQEAKAAVGAMFTTIDAADIDTARLMISDDGFVTSYDLDLEGKPVSYRSKDEVVQSITKMFEHSKQMGAKIVSRVKATDCHATSTFAVCSIDFDQAATMPDGKAMSFEMRGTGALRKGADGWKWTQWHASLAKMPEVPGPVATPAPAPAPAPLAPAAVDAKKLAWMGLEGMPGPQLAPAWMNSGSQLMVAYGKFPKKMKTPLHAHSVNAWIFVNKGAFAITAADGTRYEAKVGGMVFQPARVPHVTECMQGCEVAMITDGPMDMAMVDAQGVVGPYGPMKLVAPAAK